MNDTSQCIDRYFVVQTLVEDYERELDDIRDHVLHCIRQRDTSTLEDARVRGDELVRLLCDLRKEKDHLEHAVAKEIQKGRPRLE